MYVYVCTCTYVTMCIFQWFFLLQICTILYWCCCCLNKFNSIQLESGELEEGEGMERPKQLHLPSHFHKISSLIGLLAHQRDLLQRLEAAQGSPRESFEWASQLQYRVSSESGNVEVKVWTFISLSVSTKVAIFQDHFLGDFLFVYKNYYLV